MGDLPKNPTNKAQRVLLDTWLGMVTIDNGTGGAPRVFGLMCPPKGTSLAVKIMNTPVTMTVNTAPMIHITRREIKIDLAVLRPNAKTPFPCATQSTTSTDVPWRGPRRCWREGRGGAFKCPGVRRYGPKRRS